MSDDDLNAIIDGMTAQPNPDSIPPTDPPNDPDLGKDGQPFDAERAQRTIEAQRKAEREAKKLAKELEQANARLKEIDDAQKSELEKAQERTAELEKQLKAEAKLRRETNLRLSAFAVSPELGINDPDLALAAVTDVEYDDAGEPTNLRERLEAVCEKHPALKTPVKKPKADLDGGKGNIDAPGPELTAQQREWAVKLGMSEDEYAAYLEVKNLNDFNRVREAAKA